MSRRSKARLRLWLRLLGSTRHVESRIRERLRTEFDATLPRFDVLAALQQHGASLTMGELSRRLRVSNGNVTGIVDRLERSGHVARARRSGDRRAISVQLTDKGQQEFAVMAAAHERWVDELLSGVGTDEAKELVRLLDPVREDSA